MKPVDITPRAAPIGQHEVRMGTAEGKAARIQELEAQAKFLKDRDQAGDAEEAARLLAEAAKHGGTP